MKTKFFALMIVLSFSQFVAAGLEHLLPKPQIINAIEGATPMNLDNVSVTAPNLTAQFQEWIVTECGGTIVTTGATSTIEVQMVANISGAEFQEEAYSISVNSNKIIIQATTRQGAFWALQTLKQLANGTSGAVTIPSCTITDWPAFRIRGYMQDIGRSYMEFDEIKKEIANLARYKINVFHWHLTENQGWRLESKLYPQLNAMASYTRHPGKYYTMAQARELVKWCTAHGVTLIPEIDMPGHSAAFTRALGYNMQTTQGLATMKLLVSEIIDSCFSTSPILHIGTDEVTMTMTNFIPEMVSLIRAKGPKVGTWRRGYNGYNVADVGLCQLWASSGTVLTGTPNVDSRYHYMNHFDDFADVVGMYNSSILDVAKGSADIAGVIMAVWNDRITKTDRDIVIQNGVYPAVLATAERAWLGGGTYITRKGVMLDAQNTTAFRDFADWERRFLFHKANHLKNEPIAYVKQTNVQWRITDAFPNAGNLAASFPPETTQTPTFVKDTCTINGVKFASRKATGAGIYLRHVWGTIVPAFYANPVANSTAYAYTWVYSPTAQTVGAKIEFQNYGRSEKDLPPRQGTWDYKGSRIWINDAEVMPPTWDSQHTALSDEIPLTNENSSARVPISVNLKQGWNKVFMKLPVGAFSISQVRLVKWMFSFVLVTPDGKEAVDGLIYSPEKKMNTSASFDGLVNAIDNANLMRNSATVSVQPGEYSEKAINSFVLAIDVANLVKNSGTTDAEFNQAVTTLMAAQTIFQNSVNQPVSSVDQTSVWYTLRSVRASRYVTYKGDNAAVVGEAVSTLDDSHLWKLVKLNDGSQAIVSKKANSAISPASSNPTALKVLAGIPSSGGWNFNFIGNKIFSITSGTAQFNQSNVSPFNVLNWGSGTNTTDNGCQYTINEVNRTTTGVDKNSSSNIRIWMENHKIKVSGTTAKHEVFSIEGIKVDPLKIMNHNMVIVKIGSFSQKLIVI